MNYTAQDIQNYIGKYEKYFTHVIVAHTHFRPYVNPQNKGSEVHWIRVDEYGEFVDVWPHGFFEDRYEDLFFSTK